ncbi:MAG: radical SAM protein [Dehalococcoidales bacterium]|nr:radical SAM protein [Dehalococcoidales bacterium]
MSRNVPNNSRYRLAREQGTIIKDWGGRLPVALVYPDSYYIGMSNLGIHTIYSLLNNNPSVVAERFFYEEDRKKNPVQPLAIESERPLTDFPVIAFSVTWEPDFFHIPRLLKSAGIPLFSAERDERHPLIIAGGPCIMSNPMPLAPFFDCLCIGEAEALFPAMLPVLKKASVENRPDVLKELSKIPGLFVPRVDDAAPVRRQYVDSLDDCSSHSVIMTDDTELSNLYMIEAERGCSHACRFCLVSSIFSPVRYRSPETILKQAEEGLRYRKRIGLVGPDVSGHPQFQTILENLRNVGAEISVSSLRIKPLPAAALEELSEGKVKTVALAPEAGSQRLRSLIRKGIDEADILEAMKQVASCGINQVKLYFMIGLPTETDEDADEISALTMKCRAVIEDHCPGSRIVLSIAPFVPKAGTPFQREGMAALSVLNRRIAAVKQRLTPSGITVKADSPGWSRVQGVLSQGDEKLADVLAGTPAISLPGWQKALQAHHLDEETYLTKKTETEILPWHRIQY